MFEERKSVFAFCFLWGNIWVHLYITACLKGPGLCCMHLSLHMGYTKGDFWVSYYLLGSMGNSPIIEQANCHFYLQNQRLEPEPMTGKVSFPTPRAIDVARTMSFSPTEISFRL